MDTDLNAIKKVNTRNNLIFIADVVLFFILLNTLPFTPEANKSLALLVFIAILWLTDGTACAHSRHLAWFGEIERGISGFC